MNHVRFLFAATSSRYEGPSYDQSACVRLQGYAQMPWAAILDQWRTRNTWMAETVTNIPQTALDVICQVGDDPPMRLDELIRDYLRHLEHHVAQVMSAATDTSTAAVG